MSSNRFYIIITRSPTMYGRTKISLQYYTSVSNLSVSMRSCIINLDNSISIKHFQTTKN